MLLIGIFIALVFAYGLVSKRLEGGYLTAPMLFTLAGMLVAFLLTPGLAMESGGQAFLTVAELTLVLLLFTDASHTNLRELRRDGMLSVRLLTTGMLLTIVLGGMFAWWLFPSLGLWYAAIVGAILAPTDAGLGQVIVNSPAVPERVRESLNVEAGLNDGLSVPFLLFFIALTGMQGFEASGMLLEYIVEQLGYGAVIGLLVGGIGGLLLASFSRLGWLAEDGEQMAILSLPIMALLLSEMVEASMFIAAFVAGLALQWRFRPASREDRFYGLLGGWLSHSVFFLFGLIALTALQSLEWRYVVYGLLSLTLIRIGPVLLALAGTALTMRQRLFMGWFGPRGLASIVLGLVFLEQHGQGEGVELVSQLVVVTVWLSVMLHGASASSGIRWLNRG
ncbi:MAG: cation:proton antiporter [Pseudomonadales bacterium]|uniref:cation:proton antiporter n=1 Tax=Alcanivorax sp. MD8A TaxID=1177157 RepID=UPI000C9BDA27|nr:cation:proton antiporter [Alcanivorax sp. MD8A]MCG8438099.1 cation:proton antiporter [Pseudomonadales bacterium]MED5432389.1 cation:proton antiporter [Pseudomonadota bacterium]MEE2869318.1 cation:proton antiporter [Pseudomonadota bacterium]PNE02710.1 sodium/hydrogen exchanger [Alcanivorax sp. MD8A]